MGQAQVHARGRHDADASDPTAVGVGRVTVSFRFPTLVSTVLHMCVHSSALSTCLIS